METAIDAMEEPTQTVAARIEWEYSNALQRDNALVAALGPALGLSTNAVDNLFRAAGGTRGAEMIDDYAANYVWLHKAARRLHRVRAAGAGDVG